MRVGDAIALTIEKAVYGGDGLARHEGQAVFVPFTLPGESVTASVTQTKPGFARASLHSIDQIEQPSPDRATPPCPYYGVCGGCHYQHAAYAAQLRLKAAVLLETLSRAQLSRLPPLVEHAAEPLGYRNRVRLHLDPVTSALAYKQRASHSLLAVEQCPIAAPALQQALAALSPICAAQAGGRLFSQAELSVNHDGTELLLALTLRPGADARAAAAFLPKFAATLQQQLPALTGAGLYAAPTAPAAGKRSRVSRDRSAAVDDEADAQSNGRLLAAWGRPGMTYRVGGAAYRVSLGAFFQVNRLLVDTLVRLATEGRKGELAWDLYAGVGLFSKVLAQQFAKVVAVEGAPISAEDLRVNLPAAHVAVRSGTVEFLRREVEKARMPSKGSSLKNGPEFVLVDPPRAGLGAEATSLLAQVGPRAITYVSCDPATLGRDLRALVGSGYHIEQLHLIDLFPQTFHMEAVAILARD